MYDLEILMCVNLTLIQGTKVNMSIDALVRGLRMHVLLKKSLGWTKVMVWVELTHHYKTQLVFSNLVEYAVMA